MIVYLQLVDCHNVVYSPRLSLQRYNLEVSLESTNAELGEFKLRLSAAEGRINALESHLARTEGLKKDIGQPHHSITS